MNQMNRHDSHFPSTGKILSLKVKLENMRLIETKAQALDWFEKLGEWFTSHPGRHVTLEREFQDLLNFFCHAVGESSRNKHHFGNALKLAMAQSNALSLFSDAGLPANSGFFGEALERIFAKILPRARDDNNLIDFIELLFPKMICAAGIKDLPANVLNHVQGFLEANWKVTPDTLEGLQRDLIDALIVLAADVASLGVSKDILLRLRGKQLRDVSFLALTQECYFFVSLWLKRKHTPELVSSAQYIALLVADCRNDVATVMSHLENYGLSVHLVYRLEKINLILDRILCIVDISSSPENLVSKSLNFLSTLVQGIHDDKSIRSLARRNLRHLSIKVIERTGEQGEHYIVRNRHEWFGMLRGAAGGGVVTCFTTLLKFVIGKSQFSFFFEGLFLSANYAGSFILMQLLGFKLATKQPTMFAAAIANKLLQDRMSSDAFVSEVIKISRSQTAAVMGNICFVIPTTMMFDLAWKYFKGTTFLASDTALYAIQSLDPLKSGTLIFAALTGVILMVSSLFGSWLDNFIVFRKIPNGIARSKKLIRLIGPEKSLQFSRIFTHQVAGIGISICLGLLLGMLPALGKFFGFPIEVRHVTLSAGQLALGLSALGWSGAVAAGLAKAMLGIFCIGLLNFGVSFVLGLFLAIRARDVSVPKTFSLLKDTLNVFLVHPWAFFWLPKSERMK